jgi:hypothetical protein
MVAGLPADHVRDSINFPGCALMAVRICDIVRLHCTFRAYPVPGIRFP